MRLVIKGLVEPTVRLTAATIPHKLPHNLPSASHRFPFSLVKEQLPGATERFKSSLGHTRLGSSMVTKSLPKPLLDARLGVAHSRPIGADEP